MRIHIYATSRGVFLFDQVVALWSDGTDLRVQHHGDHITVLPMTTIREITRLDQDPLPGGWAQRQVETVYDRQEAA